MHNKSTVDDASFCVKSDLVVRLLPAIQSSVVWCMFWWCIKLLLLCTEISLCLAVFSFFLSLFWSVVHTICLADIVCMHLPLICNRTTIQKKARDMEWKKKAHVVIGMILFEAIRPLIQLLFGYHVPFKNVWHFENHTIQLVCGSSTSMSLLQLDYMRIVWAKRTKKRKSDGKKRWKW